MYVETKVRIDNSYRFNETEKNLIFSILSGILYLGNVEFEINNVNLIINDKSKKDFKIAADFLGLEANKLFKILISKKYLDPLNKNVYERTVSLKDAQSIRDAISKLVYTKMFEWIIKKINGAISNTDKEREIKEKSQILKIGILDIFGFEIFEVNSFEQLCINYANERLQQFFNNSIFNLEEDEYIKENIVWSKLNFQDNKPIIELIDHPSNSIFSHLDSEALLKNTDDLKYREKIYKNLQDNTNLRSYPGGYGDTIIIQHSAAEVEYLVYEFIEKNNDNLNSDITEELEASRNKLINYLFKKKDGNKSFSQKHNSRSKLLNLPNKIQTDSLSKQFKKQLDELILILGQSNSRFVKCIKPNSEKKPDKFDSFDVNRQLLSSGIMESVKIRRQGYSVRRTKEEFVSRYKALTPQIEIKNYPIQNKYEAFVMDVSYIYII